MDLPDNPIFADETEQTSIQQIPITELLKKYDGKTGYNIGGKLKTYSIDKLPNYLIMSFNRFPKNGEKKSAIINFPTEGLDMSRYTTHTQNQCKYDLVANVTFTGDSLDNGVFKAQLLHSSKQWYEIQDLFIEKVLAQTLHLSESCIQVWRRQK